MNTLGRADPFFQPRPKFQSSYLESLHRTYGEPRGALPKRDEAAFKRALDFRKKEKAHYASLTTENRRLQQDMEELQRRFSEMQSSTKRINDAWAKLSKSQTQDVAGSVRPSTTTTESGVSERPGLDVAEGERATDCRGGSDGDRADVVAHRGAEARQENGARLPAEKLPTEVPDIGVGRQATDDIADRPEPGSGAGTAEGDDAGKRGD